MAESKSKPFVGIQISPISFIDEGVDAVLETLQERVGINTLMIGTVSWLGLKAGRSISYQFDGWPDHGVPEPLTMKGGAYFQPHAEYYSNTAIQEFQATDPQTAGTDILEMVIPAAHSRGMKVMPELMEPLFKYAGHGSANNVAIPNMPQCLEVDLYGRYGAEPCTNNPDYRRWWHSMIEDQARRYEIDGIMWCNERRSPLDQMVSGQAPGCFCEYCRREAMQRGIEVEPVRKAFFEVWEYFQKARAGGDFVDGALIEFLRVLLRNPEILIWERFWLERNKDLDRELYGIVKWCSADLQFGLNVWNRNHFNLFRKAQWPWAEQTLYADWVKPITYQHQSGQVYMKEMSDLHKSILRDFTPQEFTPIMYKIIGLNEGPWDKLMQSGLDPDTYVYGQCADAVAGVQGKVPVYMGIGVDAPRTQADMAVCTPDIVYRSVHATYRVGGKGVIFAPNYASMKLTNLDGAAKALTELGLKVAMTTIYLADPQIRAEQLEAIRAHLPAGWALSDEPAGASAILTEHMAVTPEMLAAVGPSLHLIARLETGTATVVDTSAIPTITVVELPNTALVGVAELSVLLILALSRHLMQLNRQTLAKEWLPERSEPVFTNQQRYTYNWVGMQDFGTVYGKTAGLIGMGLIGRATASRLRAFGMKLLYTQRQRLDAATEARYGVQWRTLDDLLAQSDFVSLHHRFQEPDQAGVGGNDKHIGARELALMKPTAYLINTARGRLVDEEALVVALRTGQIAGAGLDVFRYEPFQPDSPLLALVGDNVILTPHVAGAPMVDAWRMTAQELVEHLQNALNRAVAV